MIGPPLVGQEKELENENDDSLCVDGLPNEVSCELEVFNIHIEDLSDDNNSNDDNVETTAPPTFTLTYFFSYTYTLLFCWKMKSFCDHCFSQQIRQQTTVQYIFRDYSSVRIGFNMTNKCHTLPIAYPIPA